VDLVEGEAGIGKSRLVQEFLAVAYETPALLGSCLTLGEPFTLGPVVDSLRRAREGIADLPLRAGRCLATSVPRVGRAIAGGTGALRTYRP
jgi:predicted ATPase